MKLHTLLGAGLLMGMVSAAWAQGPNNSGTYYRNADGKKGAALKTALYGIISSHESLSYDGLYTAFLTTDVRADGKIWDMYSGTSNFTPGKDENHSNYQKEGDNYNREHSFPKSWFGGSIMPMYTDLFHLYPTDSYVNGQRGNLPFGETDNPTYSSNGGFSKKGKGASRIGYTKNVFEPNDQYKGDFARTYFYMVTCYEDKVGSWASNSDAQPMLAGNKYPAFSSWALQMLLRWAQEDPVSEKETNRNNAVYKFQNNRNPFIDYPGLEQYIWGNKQSEAFSYDHYSATTSISETQVQQDDAAIYTLSGQRVTTSHLPKGVYIKGGKKYLKR